MARILRRDKAGYVVSLIFFLMGLSTLIIVMAQTWAQVSSAQNPFSAFWTLLWNENVSLTLIEFKLAYLMILGVALFISGFLVLAVSRQHFYLPGKTATFQCPFCRKKYKAAGNKALVLCPHCQQLVHPRIVED